MSEIPKAYEPQSVESKWYQFSIDHNCFTADPARVSGSRPAKVFCKDDLASLV